MTHTVYTFYKLMTGILQEILTYINVYIREVAMPSWLLLSFLFDPLEWVNMLFSTLSSVAYRRLKANKEEYLTKHAGSFYILESCAGCVNPRGLRAPAIAGRERETADICVLERARVGRWIRFFCPGYWILIQCVWNRHAQERQCYRELVARGWRRIRQWWRDHRLSYPAFSELARNTFSVMAASAVSERVPNMAWIAEEQI